jgi:two-component system OmpR family sensor kinase
VHSIRRWLLVALLALLAAVALVGGVLTYASARTQIDLLLDEELRQVALSLRDHARLDIERIERSAQRPEQRLLVQVDDARRPQPYRSRDVAPLPPVQGEGFRSVEHVGQQWRVFALPNEVQTIQVAQPLALRRALALQLTLRILAPLLLLMPLAAAVLWWIVGRALRPLDDLGRQLARRQTTTADALTPLALERLPVEAQPLVAALNDLLARLQDAFEQQRSLAADAAHALRTPLAAVTLQVQLAQRAAGAERDAALARLEAGVKRASHVTAQLLALARLDPDAAREPARPLDLAQLVRDVAEELRPLAQGAQLDLRVEAPTLAFTTGHEAALHMALTNLVDNAVRYTQAGGSVQIGLADDATDDVTADMSADVPADVTAVASAWTTEVVSTARAAATPAVARDVAPDVTPAAAPAMARAVVAQPTINGQGHKAAIAGANELADPASAVLPVDAAGWVLRVTDTGPGIPADERERVFDRFYRGRNAAVPGSGLGLAIVREVARLHGGSVQVEVGPGGRGTAIVLRLPTGRTAMQSE